ncbi:SitI3 family protein [Kitasatospora sp. NBC_00458]|uniref:SitI3 family protein n=1 Tax=Kitasatospora sp. NBC_00458 TaxID=2903568 RepID=UPI002E174CEC
MAVSHSLGLATASPVSDVAGVLARLGADRSWTAGQLVGDGALTGRGTWVRVYGTRTQSWHPVVTDLGISPTVRVAFRLAKTDDLAGQEDDVVRLVAALLARVEGDAVLDFHHETVWLLRRGGELSLHEREDLWPPQRLAAFEGRSYRRETHAFAEE